MSAVIFVNRYFYPDHSATSQMLSDLAFDLAARGREVRVLTSRQRYDDPAARLPARETIRGVAVHRVWTSRFGRHRLWGRAADYASFYASASYRLARLARPGDIVVAKTDPPLISIPVAMVARLRRAALVNWLQDVFPEVACALGMKGIAAIAPPLRRLRNAAARAARLNVVLGDRMAARLRAEGVPAERIKVIPNWSDGREIRPMAPEASLLRAQWGLRDRFVVGYSGNMGRAHEFDTVLDAAQRLAGNQRFMFLFIGGGAQRARIEQQCRQRKLRNVELKPYQPRESLALSLSVADVHLISLQPTLEGLIVPSKFYGIAAAGRPVVYIGDRDGEIPRLLRAGDCGDTVAPGDAGALTSLLASLASNRGEAVRLGRNARALFEARFDKPFAMDAWWDVLRPPGDVVAREPIAYAHRARH